jgi:hypothetical protein
LNTGLETDLIFDLFHLLKVLSSSERGLKMLAEKTDQEFGSAIMSLEELKFGNTIRILLLFLFV